MFHHAQHATRLQHFVETLEHALGLPASTPVVHVAEGQHRVDRVGRTKHRRLGVVGQDLGLAVLRGAGIELGFQRGLVLLLVVAATAFGHGSRVDHGCDVLARVMQVRSQDFRVPAAARGYLHHRFARRHTEERQRFRRVAIAIARGIRFAAPRTLQHVCQCRAGFFGCRRGSRRLCKRGNGNGQCGQYAKRQGKTGHGKPPR